MWYEKNLSVKSALWLNQLKWKTCNATFIALTSHNASCPPNFCCFLACHPKYVFWPAPTHFPNDINEKGNKMIRRLNYSILSFFLKRFERLHITHHLFSKKVICAPFSKIRNLTVCQVVKKHFFQNKQLLSSLPVILHVRSDCRSASWHSFF